LDDSDPEDVSIDVDPPSSDRDGRVKGTSGESSGAVVIHIEYRSKHDLNEVMQSLRSLLPSNLVADPTVMEMDWEEERDD
jgi:hypothetical protein